MKNPVEVIDWHVYGALVRNQRIKNGYRKIEAFVNALWFRVRVTVSKDTLYKIEMGKQAPSVEVFLGINLVLYGEFLPQKLFDISLSDEWEQIASIHKREGAFFYFEPFVPHNWANENFKKVKEIYNEDKNESDPDFIKTAADCVELTGEPKCVFGGSRAVDKVNQNTDFPDVPF